MAERLTPTQKQVTALQALDPEALVTRALEAMHCLNRRAKEKRDRANTFRRATFSDRVREEIEEIYEIKNQFLVALVDAGLAKVYVFQQERCSRAEWECEYCSRTWVGEDGMCRRCGGAGSQISVGGSYQVPWYVVECHGFRFHQPEEYASSAMVEQAVEIEAHSPEQARRDIPKIGLTVEAQFKCVRLAIERLPSQSEVSNG